MLLFFIKHEKFENYYEHDIINLDKIRICLGDSVDINVILIYTFILGMVVILFIIRHECRKKFVFKTSFFYNNIVDLNEISNLKYLDKQLKFCKTYKSKAAVVKASLNDAAVQYVSENQDYVENLIRTYRECNNLYSAYKKVVDNILETKFDYSKLKLSRLLFFSLNNYIKFENKMVNEIIYENTNNLTLYVRVEYISPKGQNYWYKDHEYSFTSIVAFVKTVKQHEEYMKSAKYQRSILSDSLRYDVLKRDNFTCQICGASSKKDGVKLEVDHIFPISKGGKTEMSNLQTLCERCNRGKSNKY